MGRRALRHRSSRGNDCSRRLSGQLRKILRAFDEPFAGVVSTYFLSQRMARHVKVAVAGDGADELFGSYLSHRVAAGAEPCPTGCRPIPTGSGAPACWS